LTTASSAVAGCGSGGYPEERERSCSQIIASNAEDLSAVLPQAWRRVSRIASASRRSESKGLATLWGVIRSLPDPVGDVIREMTLQNGLQVTQVRVPFGVIGAIYEATTQRHGRHHRTRSQKRQCRGAARRRSSTGEQQSARVSDARCSDLGGPARGRGHHRGRLGREGAQALMKGRGFIDVLIPRGSASLIETVVTESSVPVIETGQESSTFLWTPPHPLTGGGDYS
jgi:glutamate-5-semialdehyde dehydrogenase